MMLQKKKADADDKKTKIKTNSKRIITTIIKMQINVKNMAVALVVNKMKSKMEANTTVAVEV